MTNTEDPVATPASEPAPVDAREDLPRRFAWIEQRLLDAIVAAKDVGAHVSVTTTRAQALGLAKRARTLYESHGGA